MARNRMIKPEFFDDLKLSKLSAYARLLYIGLWGLADDNYATLPNEPAWIKAKVFPYNHVKVERLLDELSSSHHIVLFTASDKQDYWYLPNFKKHQKIDRPSTPKYPEYLGVIGEGSTSTLSELKEVKEKENKKTEGNPKGNNLQPSAAVDSSLASIRARHSFLNKTEGGSHE